jgi:hypothetical protein
VEHFLVQILIEVVFSSTMNHLPEKVSKATKIVLGLLGPKR